jgi:uncharacterized protein (TIGR00266 family)
MKHRIIGDTFPILVTEMDAGEEIISQTHAFIYADEGIVLDTELSGGALKGIRRMAGGESLFLTKFRANKAGEIGFASGSPGKIFEVNLNGGKEFYLERHAYLCSEPSVNLDIAFTKRISAGLFGGEGFIFERLSGTGKAFGSCYGDLIKKTLNGTENVKVSTGLVVGFEKGIDYDIEFLKRSKNILFSGEGLFMTVLSGKGDVFLQSINSKRLVGALRLPPTMS